MNPRHDTSLHIHSQHRSVPFCPLPCAGMCTCACVPVNGHFSYICKGKQSERLLKENLYTVKFTFMYSLEFDKLQLCTKTVKTTCSSSLRITCSDPVINLHPAPPCCQSPVSSALLVSPFPECKAAGTAHSILRVWLLLLANVSGIDPCSR